MEDYFVISNVNGTARTTRLSKEDLVSRLNPDEHGDVFYPQLSKFINPAEITAGGFNGYPHDSLLLIKGTIVVPKVTQTVTVE